MQKTLTQKLTLTGTGILAVFALAACGGSGDTEAGESIELQDNQSSSAPAQTDDNADDNNDDRRDDADDTQSAGASGSGSDDRDDDDDRDDQDDDQSAGSAAGGSDPAFDAIDAVKGAASGAIVISMDRDDREEKWDITTVEGDEVVEYDVTPDGEVKETERERDDDDEIDEANRAEVSIADAITTALEGRDGQHVDDVDLEEEDGTLRWEIDFDDEDRRDADEVHIDAITGEVLKG